ncbi:MAG: 30S ribosomal protein S13 [Nanoarchaeota archaeon]
MAQKAQKQESVANFVRIASTDINGNATLVHGLSNIKGIGKMFSNALCVALGLDKNLKVGDLSEKQIETIEEFLANPEKKGIPEWMLNYRKNPETGENHHLATKDIDFNLMQLKRKLGKLKTYRGLRLRLGLPVRGQRTASNFRRNKTLASKKAKSLGKR